jgi:hypothetical protein
LSVGFVERTLLLACGPRDLQQKQLALGAALLVRHDCSVEHQDVQTRRPVAIAADESDHEGALDGALGEIERLRAELADERERRIAAEALAEERGEALASARKAARFRNNAAPPAPTQEISLRQRTVLRGNWLQ